MAAPCAEGRAEGEKIGEARGEAKGINLFGKLISCLLSLGRNDDIERAAVDGEYRDQLFKEFGLS